MTIYQRLKKILDPLKVGLSYATFPSRDVKLPYAIYMGGGAENAKADNRVYFTAEAVRLEYYYKQKDEMKEKTLEKGFGDGGYIWEKSSDVYLADEGIFMIYYDLFFTESEVENA